jgi:hypothetical protein
MFQVRSEHLCIFTTVQSEIQAEELVLHSGDLFPKHHKYTMKGLQCTAELSYNFTEGTK